MRTAHDWYDILVKCYVKPTVAAHWAAVFAEGIAVDTFSRGDEELDDFIGQVLHETGGLEHLEENLNYTATRMAQVWPTRFARVGEDGHKLKDVKGLFVPNANALACANNPERLGNAVYGGRLGNAGNEGYLYRGRGFPHVTGRDNYKMVGDAIGVDLVADPAQLLQPSTALKAGIAWWERRVPDSAINNAARVTKAVNGGAIGLAHRGQLTDAAGEALV